PPSTPPWHCCCGSGCCCCTGPAARPERNRRRPLMPDLWLPGIPHHDTKRRLTMAGQNGARIFTWHTFEAPYSLSMDAAWRYLRSQASDPHFVFNPVTGDLVQMLPATTGGRTLVAPDWPRVHTNTYGAVHMQV